MSQVMERRGGTQGLPKPDDKNIHSVSPPSATRTLSAFSAASFVFSGAVNAPDQMKQLASKVGKASNSWLNQVGSPEQQFSSSTKQATEGTLAPDNSTTSNESAWQGAKQRQDRVQLEVALQNPVSSANNYGASIRVRAERDLKRALARQVAFNAQFR